MCLLYLYCIFWLEAVVQLPQGLPCTFTKSCQIDQEVFWHELLLGFHT